MPATFHMTRDGHRTVCGKGLTLTTEGFRTTHVQSDGPNCVQPADWEAVTCDGCMDWFHEPPTVDMSRAMRAELPAY
jgi:hypothetical protein